VILQKELLALVMLCIIIVSFAPVVSKLQPKRGYRKPGGKAPVIRPGDEAPFLVWGGEGSALRAAMRRLTEAGKPAMLGIDVLA
jgi:hypothetical protein